MTDREYQELLNNTEEVWVQLILFHQLLNYDISNTGKIRLHSTEQELKLSYNKEMKNCYRYISITLNDGKKYNTEIHRLMAIMFIPIPKSYTDDGYTERTLTVNHKDGIKYHNVLENLEWLTVKENGKHAIETGLHDPYNHIDYITAHEICKMLEKGFPIYTIAEDLNVTESIVYSIRYKHTWRDVSKQYIFPSRQLAPNTVRVICEYICRGYNNKMIAELLHIKEGVIQHIRGRKTWTNISNNYEFPEKRISREKAIKICVLLEQGKSISEVCETLDVGKRTVEHIRARETWTDISKDYEFTYQKFKVADIVIHGICQELSNKNKTMRCIANEHGVSLTFVKDIKYRRHRTDISSQYNW